MKNKKDKKLRKEEKEKTKEKEKKNKKEMKDPVIQKIKKNSPIILDAQPIFKTQTAFITVIKEHLGSFYYARQDGVIYRHTNGRTSQFLDIRDRVLYSGLNELGLLAFTFHSNDDHLFYLWFSEKPTAHQLSNQKTVTPFIPLDPKNPNSLKQQWINREVNFNHINRLEEWRIEENGGPHHQTTLLRLLHPFQNHNGSNNLFYDDDLNRLILATGDGGAALDPFNLAQNDNELHGKILAINVNHVSWKNPPNKEPSPVTQSSQLTPPVKSLIRVIGKGIRNPSRIDQKGNLKFLSMAGQSSMEAGFTFLNYYKNFLWRPFDNPLPNFNVSPIMGHNSVKTTHSPQITFLEEVLTLLDRNQDLWRPIVHYANSHSIISTETSQTILNGVSISGLDWYRGGRIAQLENNLIIADLLNPKTLNGQIFRAELPNEIKSEDQLQISRKLEKITVNNLLGPITTLYVTQKGRILVAHSILTPQLTIEKTIVSELINHSEPND